MAPSSDQVVRIFVSHSSKDDDFGARLVEDLRRALNDETAVWYDSRGGLYGGDTWWNKIMQELKSRNVFIVVLSPDAVASKWVNDEINLAWRQRNTTGKLIIPIQYRKCEVRDDLDTLQIISFQPPKSYEEAFKELLLVLRLSIEVLPEGHDLALARGLSIKVLNIHADPEKYGKSAAQGIYDLVQAWPEGYDLALARGEGRIDSGAGFLAIWDEKQAIVFDKRFQQLRQELWGEQSEQIESEILQQMEDAKRAIQPLLDTEGTSVVLAPYNAAPDTCEVSLQGGVARVRYKDTANLGITTNSVRAEVAAGSNIFARMFYKPNAQEAYALSLLEIHAQSQEQLAKRFAIARAIVGLGTVYLASYAMDRGINPDEHHMARTLLTNLPNNFRAVNSHYQRLSANLTSGKSPGVS